MMDVRSDKEGCGQVVKARASPSGTAGAARYVGGVARAVRVVRVVRVDVAGESGDERKSSFFD
jgi:hypothetical protein